MSGFTAFMSDTDSDTFFGVNLTLNTLFVAENIWQKISGRNPGRKEEILGGTDSISDICSISNKSSFTRWSIQLILCNNRFICCHQVQTVGFDKQLVWIESELLFWSVVLPKHSIVLQAVNYVFREICILLLMHVYVNRASHIRIIHFYDP